VILDVNKKFRHPFMNTMHKPLHQFTATEIVSTIAAGKTTAVAVAESCLEYIAEREPQVEAWHYLDPELVLKQARALDKRGSIGALQGVPVGIKDIIDTADMPTEYGTPIHKGRRPGIDATCVALTRRAGGMIMGKTVTTEFANFFPGKTRNPFDSQRTPGGSSSGSGAAVGAEMVPLAIGTQTTASTIRPAAFCGCVGYRPTWGDLRCTGVMEASGSLDTLGLIARSVEDIALYRDVLLGVTPAALPPDSAAPRIGFCRTHIWDQCEPETQQLIEDCAAKLARAGAKVSDVSLPGEFTRIEEAHRWISSFEFARNRAWEIDHHWDMISERLRNNRIRDGLDCSYETYRDARDFLERQRLVLDDLMADYDVLLTPAAAGEAPLGLQATGNASFCAIWTSMHVPAMTLPLFRGRNGLPVGAQLIGKRNDDRRVFEAARWVQRAFG
jgi:Asp-tRNA(Asn)/Glu-tRNA(Gln) amidotransferase A subunit family amidase